MGGTYLAVVAWSVFPCAVVEVLSVLAVVEVVEVVEVLAVV